MAEPSEIVSTFLRSQIKRGSFPGAQYAIGRDEQIIAEDALGLAVVEPERVATTLDTVYDLASLTKPLVTALLIMRFYERGLLQLNAPVAHYLSEFDSTGRGDITLLSLLIHTSSLPNWLPLYLEAQTREQIPAAIARTLERIEKPAAEEVLYSDLNYILLGFILERVSGEALEDKTQEDVVEIAVEHFLRGRLFNPFEGPRDCGRDLLACLCFQIERKPVGKRRSVNK